MNLHKGVSCLTSTHPVVSGYATFQLHQTSKTIWQDYIKTLTSNMGHFRVLCTSVALLLCLKLARPAGGASITDRPRRPRWPKQYEVGPGWSN